jgi:hypothetical protein
VLDINKPEYRLEEDRNKYRLQCLHVGTYPVQVGERLRVTYGIIAKIRFIYGNYGNHGTILGDCIWISEAEQEVDRILHD